MQDVNLTVNKGEFVYLVGKTGTGKSSLLKTLYGELTLTEGEATVAGFSLRTLDWRKVPYLRRTLGVVFQDFKMPFELSGGEQQRVDIARALLNSPKLILADEPTGNLDPETSDEIMNLLFHICKDFNTTIVMATHDYIVVQKFPARTIKTERGKVIDNATITIE